ncbi:MAG: DUF721 domain-containing protein [Deltaproteobacteria bacterium]|nr:DUF721 domain-containing protein [Deltaproteobacteria bacterium]
MPKKNHHIDRIGDVLDQSLKRLDLAPQLEAYGIWPVWNDVVGKAVARNAQPEKIRHGTLFVKVSSPVWMQQLQFMKDLITEKINERLRAEVVKNIFFIVGTVEPTDAEPSPRRENMESMADRATQIDERFLESVQDPEVRQAFKKLLRNYARSKKKI